MSKEAFRRTILTNLAVLVDQLEGAEQTSRYWLPNEEARLELRGIVEKMKALWLELDEFFAIWLTGGGDGE
jgi:hypothetical protein